MTPNNKKAKQRAVWSALHRGTTGWVGVGVGSRLWDALLNTGLLLGLIGMVAAPRLAWNRDHPGLARWGWTPFELTVVIAGVVMSGAWLVAGPVLLGSGVAGRIGNEPHEIVSGRGRIGIGRAAWRGAIGVIWLGLGLVGGRSGLLWSAGSWASITIASSLAGWALSPADLLSGSVVVTHAGKHRWGYAGPVDTRANWKRWWAVMGISAAVAMALSFVIA